MAETPKFEDGLAALERLVNELEAGELGLDEALKRFEGGVKLAGQLQKALEESQRKVEKLAAGGLEAFADGESPEPVEGPAPKKTPRKPKPEDPSLF